MSSIFRLFGRFLMWLNTTTGSYVLALVIFTVLIKLCLFPFSIMSKKSMMKTQSLQGKMEKLQKQYGKDREKYNMEVQKLYEEEGVNPMGGCLWSLIPLPILWGVYAIVRQPLSYMYNLTSEQVTAVQMAVEGVVGELSSRAAYIEIQIASLLNSDATVLEAAKSDLGDASSVLDKTINFNFIGIDLSQTPQLKFWENGVSWASIGLFLLPILLAVVSFLTSMVTQRTNKVNRNQESTSTDRTTRQMLIMMPLMYIWFGFIMPAGMCIYMMISCIIQMLQELLASRILRSRFMEAQTQKEEAERQRKLEEKRKRQEKIEQRQREEEEAKKRRKKNAVSKKSKDNSPKTDKGAIGIRRYALGRNYEPDRFGGVTAYRDPTDIVDEAAVEAALAKKKKNKRDSEQEDDTTVLTSEVEENVISESVEEVEEVVAEAEAIESETEESVEEHIADEDDNS